jgi:hypothetical protein
MTSDHASMSASAARHAAETRSDAVPWVATGLASGVVGAAIVALFFLVLDWIGGQPLWTPNTLGSALFRGEVLPADAPLELAMVLGYTAVHGVVFVGFGLISAFILMSDERGAGAGRTAGLAVALFAAFEASFLVFAWLFEPGLMAQLGAGWVALANALAAVAMSLFLMGGDRRTRRRRGEI